MKYLVMVLGFMMTVCTWVVCFAQAALPPENTEQALAWVQPLLAAVVAGNWTVAGGIAIMVVVVVLRQFLLPTWKISQGWLPIITVVIGALANLGLSMATGVSSSTAIWEGIIMSLTAAGIWDLIGGKITKLILGDKYQEPVKPVQFQSSTK